MGLQHPSDLARAVLLHTTLHPCWETWLHTSCGMSSARFAQISALHFEQALLAIEAAKRHQGAVLKSAWLIEQELAEGCSLIEPFEFALKLSKAYYVVHPCGAHLRTGARALMQWLSEGLPEAKRQDAYC